jgi:hypothetical protein
VADAMARKSLDSMVVELNGKVALLESDKITTAKNFNDLLVIERDRAQIEKEIAQQQKAISGTYKDEVKHLKKKVRSRTWQRNGAAGIAIVFLVLAVLP